MPTEGGDIDWAKQRAQGMWKSAFGRFLIANYPKFMGIGKCGAFKTLAEAQAYAQSMAPDAQQISSGAVVETGWACNAPAN